MQPSRPVSYFFYTALILLVLAGVGNIHSHSCLDGQEPAVSVHFENFKGHPEHEPDEVHVDFDSELMAQALPGKSLDQDSPLFLTAAFFVLCIDLPQSQHYVTYQHSSFYEMPGWLSPPLRAPPFHSS